MVLGADAQSQDRQPAGLPVLAGRAWVLPINKATRGPPARGSVDYVTAACSMRQTGPPVSGGCGVRGAVMGPGDARGPTAGPTGGGGQAVQGALPCEVGDRRAHQRGAGREVWHGHVQEATYGSTGMQRGCESVEDGHRPCATCGPACLSRSGLGHRHVKQPERRGTGTGVQPHT